MAGLFFDERHPPSLKNEKIDDSVLIEWSHINIMIYIDNEVSLSLSLSVSLSLSLSLSLTSCYINVVHNIVIELCTKVLLW